MSVLLSYAEADPARAPESTQSASEIAQRLAAYGVHFERWRPLQVLPRSPIPGLASRPEAALALDDEAAVLSAYAHEIERLEQRFGYRSHDLVRMQQGDSDAASWQARVKVARAKFLEEHVHAEDEVRFFVQGSGLFTLRLSAQGAQAEPHGATHVVQVLCEAGDLLSVPAGTRHWFDMGSAPSFCALRLFGSPDGWVASFTGDPIAQRFPTYDELAQQWR